MRLIEIKAYSIAEAIRIARKKYGIKIIRNSTTTWREYGGQERGKLADIAFSEIYSTLGLHKTATIGAIVTLDPGKKNSRIVRPYKQAIHYPPNLRKRKRFIEIRLSRNNEVIGEAQTKREALKAARDLMSIYNEDMYAEIVYRITHKKGVVFELHHNLSWDAHAGRYLIISKEP